MKISTITLLLISLFLTGCDSSTPQASDEVKKQVLGRKPTAEELQKAMGNTSERQQAGRPK